MTRPPHVAAALAQAERRERLRLITRMGFFALFVLAPLLDLFRLDLDRGHFILLGWDWTLGLDDFIAGRIGPGAAAWNVVWRGFLPLAGVVGGVLLAAWYWGRVYCGWLCPHFSVVETVNGLMRRALGKPTLWEAKSATGDVRWQPLLWLAVAGFALLWAVTLLTYLLPPAQVWGNLLAGTPTRNQMLFIVAATAVFLIDFTLARHLFCRYVCAVGLFQSYAWMANKRALVVGFDRGRAAQCATCTADCDTACPMRLKPRSIKRKMFTCTQCAQCLTACARSQADHPAGAPLRWVQGQDALEVSARDFGRGTPGER